MDNNPDSEAQLVQAYRDMYLGMVGRDIGLLDGLLDVGYTLTHMTGYQQSRSEWLAQVSSGEMRYHDAQERSVAVQVTGDTAVLVGRSIVNATIWGSRGTWPLQLTTNYQLVNGGWIALSTVATTF